MTHDMAWRTATIGLFAGLALCLLLTAIAFSRDLGQWEGHDPAIRAWFSHLKQPDAPQVSCCGESDAYYADEVKYKNGRMIAVITDEREDAPLMRQHEDLGTEYEVPSGKITRQDGNPTGHVIIFLGGMSWLNDKKMPRPVLCYVMNGGV